MALIFPDRKPNNPHLAPEEVNALKAAVNANTSAVAAATLTANAALPANDLSQILAGITPNVQADDPTSASLQGWYLATGSGDLFYKSADGLFTIAGAYAADPSIPSVLTATISGATGDTLTIVFSENVTMGVDWEDGFLTVTGDSTGLATCTYQSGDGTDTLVFSLSAGMYDTETCLFQYTGADGSILASSTGGEVLPVADGAVINDSELTSGE